MRFTVSAAAFLAFVSSALAQNPNFGAVRKPGKQEKVQAGTTFEIKWDVAPAFADVTVAISLIGGPTQGSQQPLLVIAKNVPIGEGKYNWAVDASLNDGFPWHGIVVASEKNPTVDFQFSDPFDLVPAEGSSNNGTTTIVTTVTTGSATKTVSLSSVSTTSTPSPAGNSTTPGGPRTITSTINGGNGGAGGPATTSSTTIATVRSPGAGAQATAGAFAVLGGFAIAALAL